MLSVTFKPFMMNVIMLNAIMLNVIMLNATKLNVIMLTIVAPSRIQYPKLKAWFFKL